jgi:uncharacterized protein (DUF1499 family)
MTSTMGPTSAVSTSRRWLRRLPLLALLLAIAALLLLAIGPLGWRAGWWHFRFAFSTLLPWAFYCGVAAALVAVLAIAVNARAIGKRHLAVAVLAFVIGGATAYVPWHYDHMRGTVPPINDITTDWENPPQFQAVLPARTAAEANSTTYAGAKVSEQQRKAYPDIVPLTLSLAPQAAFDRALAVAKDRGWTIVASDLATGHIEASQSSRWFGFTDDIVIRVAAADTGSRVDIRSESRYGRSDFGVNAARIRGYIVALREAAGGKS